MQVQITSVDILPGPDRFQVMKEIEVDGNTEVNEHHIPIVAVGNYASHYGVTLEQALDFILFQPFMSAEDWIQFKNDGTVDDCKDRLQAGDLAEVHQFILEEVRKRGAVPQTHLDSPSSGYSAAGEPVVGPEHG